MRFAIMGAGALGGYFGGRLQAGGASVVFLARGAQLEALRRDGLTIESPLGDLRLPSVRAEQDPAAAGGPVDVVLFLVKLYDTEAAAAALAPLLGPETAVVTFQNGVEAAERIGAAIGSERVMIGSAYIPADLRAPGVVRHNAPFATLLFGERDRRESARARALRDALKAAGISADIAPDIEETMWRKFVFLSALSATTATLRRSIGAVREDPEGRAFLEAAVAETAAVGRAELPRLPEDAASQALGLLMNLQPNVRASMLDDLERGKRLELHGLSGAVARLGAAHGIATPAHDRALAALAPFADGRPA